MEVTIVYFSQTGNTRKAAEAMASGFRDLGHSARTVPLKKAAPEDATAGDLLGIGSPCFTGQAPTPIKDYLRALPPLADQRAFVFATAGGAPGKVLHDLTRPLRRKGADVVGGTLVRGECFHPAPCFVGRYPGRPDAQDLNRARRFAQTVAEHVAAGVPGPVPESRPDALKRRWGLYELEGMFTPDPMVRLVLPRPKLDQSRCDQCRWCVYECPTDNISMHPHPVLGGRCIRCYRCLTGCPQKAFRVGWLLGNLVLLSLHSTTFERWFGDLDYDEAIYREADKPTSNWTFEMLVAALHGRSSGGAAAAAARALGEIGHERAVRALTAALQARNGDDGAHTREAAAEALGRTKNTRAIEPLISSLRDQHRHVRSAAAAALGHVGTARAVEGLALALQDTQWSVRQAAAEALGRIGTSRAFDQLLLVLSDESAAVRRSAQDGLRGIVEWSSPDPAGAPDGHSLHSRLG